LIDELENDMLKERANVLSKMKEFIKLFSFKTSDFMGALKTRAKRSMATKKPSTQTAK